MSAWLALRSCLDHAHSYITSYACALNQSAPCYLTLQCFVLETVQKRHVFVNGRLIVIVNIAYCNTSSMHVLHGTTCVARFIAVTTMVHAHLRADWHPKKERVSLTFPPARSLCTAKSQGKANVTPPTENTNLAVSGPSTTQKHCEPTPSDTYPLRHQKNTARNLINP